MFDQRKTEILDTFRCYELYRQCFFPVTFYECENLSLKSRTETVLMFLNFNVQKTSENIMNKEREREGGKEMVK